MTEINWNAVEVNDFTKSNDAFSDVGISGGGITMIFGNSVKSIPASLFNTGSGAYSYPNITSVVIGENVESIGSRAFSDIKGLASITIPISVTNIDDYAFSGCDRLIEVYNKSTLDITAGSSENGNVAYYAKHVYTEEGGSWLTDTADGFRFFYDGTDGYLIGYYGEETAITLPDGFTAYDGTEVAEYAIYDYAFYSCDGLTSVTIGNSVTSIGSYAFATCSDLASVAIGDSVTSIGERAFLSCNNLTSIAIPDSVTDIGYWTFSGCTGLTSVTYEGSVAEWNAIYKDSYWNFNCPFTKVVCLDGTVRV